MLTIVTAMLRHAGHGTHNPAGVLHYFVEPMHAAGAIGLLFMAGFLTLVFRRRRAAAKVHS